MSPRIEILFNTWANAGNVNSQSLTARELARRLDAERFSSTLWLSAGQAADPQLMHLPHVRFVRVPPRLGSAYMAGRMLWGGHDILFYPAVNARASRLFWRWKARGRRQRVIENVECSLEQIRAGGAGELKAYEEVLRGADECFAITPAIAGSLGRAYGIRADVVPLGVDLELFQPVDRSGRTGRVRVLDVATLQARKQPHLILEFAGALQGEDVEFHLIGPVIGDAKYAEGLYAEKERAGLSNVFFHGALPPEMVSRWMQECDLFVLPSRLEGFGKVMIEAGATGLPSLIFDDYESTAVVDGVTGFQVRTEGEMLDALYRLIRDKALRLKMGAAAVEHSKQFDWNKITRKWEAIFLGGGV